MRYTSVNDVHKQLQAILPTLKKISEYIPYIDDSEGTIESRTIHGMLRKHEDNLYRLVSDLERLEQPIAAEGRLFKRSDGRYGIEGTDYYFTSGSHIEVLVDEDEPDDTRWAMSRVEHHGDYYIMALGTDKDINGMMVRVRETI